MCGLILIPEKYIYVFPVHAHVNIIQALYCMLEEEEEEVSRLYCRANQEWQWRNILFTIVN